MTKETRYDLVIVGGGLVGASLAVALRDSGLSIGVVERWPLASDNQPSYDERTVALTWSARCIFKGMGIWEAISNDAEPIRDIHVSGRGAAGATHLSHRHAGTPALGYVVPTRVIGNALMKAIGESGNIRLLCPAEAVDQVEDADSRRLTVRVGDEPHVLRAPLVVIADGGRSGLAGDAAMPVTAYPQEALLSIVSTTLPHRGRAWERFCLEGPLALLPLADNRLAVVWTCLPDTLSMRRSLPDDEFIDHLQSAFGNRAGSFFDPSPRKSYPLGRGHLECPASRRQVVIGNAAHTVHPVAGQGFNLGLRDVAALAELLFEAGRTGGDPGSEAMLSEYVRMRRRDTYMVRQFTHGLISLFSADIPPVSIIRSLGLTGIELMPPLKRLLLRRTMGMAGRQGRLARGLPLDGGTAMG